MKNWSVLFLFIVSELSAAPLLVDAGAGSSGPVSVASDIYFEFDRNVLAGSGNITLTNNDGDIRQFDVNDSTQISIRGNRLRVNALSDLNANSSYSISMSSGAVQDSSGNNFSGTSSAYSINTGKVIYAQGLRANNSSVGLGTSANPYESIGYASTVAQAGDTVYVRHTEDVISNSYSLSAVGTRSAPVYIKPESGTTGPYSFVGANSLKVEAASNMVIEGFTFDGGSDKVTEVELMSEGLWTQTSPQEIGGIAINVKQGSDITIRDNVFRNLQQKAVNIQDGRYVNVTGNIIHDVATKSLSGGHGIMRQQGSGNFGNADEAGIHRWDISGNLIFNVEQRIYSWVPSKGYMNMVLDEGKPILIDETTDRELSAQITNNIVAFGGIDAIRIKPTANLEVSNNSVYAKAPLADGITDINTLKKTEPFASDPFPGLVVRNNLVQTGEGTFSLELNDGFPTAAAASGKVSGNVVSGGIVKPSDIGGVSVRSGSLFVDPENGDFSPSVGVPNEAGADAVTRTDLANKVARNGIEVKPSEWNPDHLFMTQTILDAIPGINDGVSGNESIFTDAGQYGDSVREEGRKSLFFSVNEDWRKANGVKNADLEEGKYEIILPEEYSDWVDTVASQFGEYTDFRWGDTVIAQDKVIDGSALTYMDINSLDNFTQTLALENTLTLDGSLLLDFTDYAPENGDRFDLFIAESISGAAEIPFDEVLILGLDPLQWGLDFELIDGVTMDSFLVTVTPIPEPQYLIVGVISLGWVLVVRRRK